MITSAARTPTSTISTSSTATATAARPTASRPSPRNCASRASCSATGSTGWSAAITPTRSCEVNDNLAYGADYARFANCLIAQNFAALTGQAALVAPDQPDLLQSGGRDALPPLVAGRQCDGARRAVRSASAAARRVQLAPFTNSGFTNVAIAFGGGIGRSTASRSTTNMTRRTTTWRCSPTTSSRSPTGSS